MKCKKCDKEYKATMFHNFNLDLCDECYEKAENDGSMERSESVDEDEE